MSKIKLTNYLNRVEAKYIKAREDWEKVQKELSQENENFNNINWMNYSNQGRQEESMKHEEKKRELQTKLEKIRTDFIEAVEGIRKDSDKIFNRVFQYTASDVDQNGVSILQNSSMSPSELMEFAESYRQNGNYTMYFMIAEKLKSDKKDHEMNESERKAKAYYQKAKSRREEREDHELIEGFKEICLKSLRDEDYLSNGVHKIHSEFYEDYKTETEKIEADSFSPWES